MPSLPHESATDADAVVILVEDWRATFQMPHAADDQLDAGPRWLVPAGGLLGLVLAALTLSRPEISPSFVAPPAVLVLMACAAVMTLRVGGPRGVVAATAGATTVWVPGMAAVLGQGDVDTRLVAVLLAAGAAGQIVFVERMRAGLAGYREVVLAARAGARSEGWVIATSGPPWDTVLRVAPSDGDGGPWTGTHADWRAVRPSVGHPVSIWRTDSSDAVVVLLPRLVD